MARRAVFTALWRAVAVVGLWLAAGGSARAGPPPSPRAPASDVLDDIFTGDRNLPRLESRGDGGLRHRGDGFTATIRPDGSVQFRDFVDRDLALSGFHLRRRRLEPTPFDRREPWIVAFEEEAMFPLGRLPVAGISGRFGGLADWMLGQKHAGAKRAFLAATAGLRYRLAYAWQRARMLEQLAALNDQLVSLWRDPALSLQERRRRLFALWDECAEPGLDQPGVFDRLREAAGLSARAKIAAFVRMVAVPGTPEAFSEAELARLNSGRDSVARFEPYRDDGGPPPGLPELPAAPARAPIVEDEAVAHGPMPEPSVVVPEPAPAPVPAPARPASKTRRLIDVASGRIGPVRVRLGTGAGRRGRGR